MRSATRALLVLEFLSSRKSAVSAMTIARSCGIPRSSMYPLLAQMHEMGFVEYYPEGHCWSLGASALNLGSNVMAAQPLAEHGRPILQALASKVKAPAQLAVLRDHEVLYLVKERPKGSTTEVLPRAGVRLPAHRTAVGLSILMSMDPRNVLALYSQRRPLVHDDVGWPTNLDAFQRSLDAMRAVGHASIADGVTIGITGIAAPVLDADHRPIAGVSISVVTDQQSPESHVKLGAVVVQAARRLSAALTTSRPEVSVPSSG
jgi:DNA-binding IclR family transcriptional regulator